MKPKSDKVEKNLILFLIILVGAILISGTFIFIKYIKEKNEGISYNGVTLSVEDYKAITNKFNDYAVVRVCDINSSNCILLTNIDAFNSKK